MKKKIKIFVADKLLLFVVLRIYINTVNY